MKSKFWKSKTELYSVFFVDLVMIFRALRDDLSKIATALENGLMEEVKPEKKVCASLA